VHVAVCVCVRACVCVCVCVCVEFLFISIPWLYIICHGLESELTQLYSRQRIFITSVDFACMFFFLNKTELVQKKASLVAHA